MANVPWLWKPELEGIKKYKNNICNNINRFFLASAETRSPIWWKYFYSIIRSGRAVKTVDAISSE